MQFDQALPYHPDSGLLFDALADEPWSVFLDSGRGNPITNAGATGRFDILTSHPYITLTGRDGITELRRNGAIVRSSEDPFELLRRELAPRIPPRDGIPFPGGAIGWFGYDLARRLHRISPTSQDDTAFPDFAVGLYDWALLVDHGERTTRLIAAGRDAATKERWNMLVDRLSAPGAARRRAPFRRISPLAVNLDPAAYATAFSRVRHYIREGDCYQVNLTRRFEARCEGDPWEGYRRLREIAPAPFSAYVNTPEVQILCGSPERFLEVRGDRVETRPIKGTRPRSADPEEDRRLAGMLRESLKDRAENLMIVDLLRNDLGRVCRPGSIEVPELFKVESFPQVHHLVSTVRGRLAPGRDALALLRASFPGGSITGAPKGRAMQIIEELEPHRRGLYCGVIGYLGFDGGMDSNIVIRSLVHRQGRVHFSAGGGIVADSDREQEFAETCHKASAFFRLLDSPGL